MFTTKKKLKKYTKTKTTANKALAYPFTIYHFRFVVIHSTWATTTCRMQLPSIKKLTSFYMESHVRLYLLRQARIYTYILYIWWHKSIRVMLLVELMKNSKVLKQTNLHFWCESATKPAAMIFVLFVAFSFFAFLLFFSNFKFQFSFMHLYFLFTSLSDFYLIVICVWQVCVCEHRLWPASQVAN